METTTAAIAVAQQHHQTGNLHQAEELYRQILQTVPNQAEVLHGLGAIAYQRGQYDQAIAWLREAVALQRTNAILFSNLGAAHRAAGQPAEAEACYLQALRLRPDSAEAYNNLGNVLKEQGRPEEALARYRQALLTKPNYPEAHLNLGLALREQGQRQEALAHLQQAARARPESAETHSGYGLVLRELGRLEEAVDHLRQALRLRPQEAQHYVNLAVALQEQGNLDEAVAHFQEALRLQPDLAEAHLNLGLAWLRQDQWEDALTCFEQALQLKPNLPQAHYYLGHALLRQGQLDQAVAHFQQLPALRTTLAGAGPEFSRVAKKPSWSGDAVSQGREPFARDSLEVEVQFQQAVALREHGRLDEAKAAFQRFLSLWPNSAEAHYNLGLIWQRQKKGDESIRHWREALRLNPDLAEAHVALGVALGGQGQLEEAVTALHQALRVRPDYAEAYLHLGTALREQGHLERSAAYLREALQLWPNLAAAHDQLGLTLTEQGKLDEARAAYQEALRLAPDSVPSLTHLGNLCELLGQPEEGQRLLERALTLDPDDCQVHTHYGTALVEQGRVEQARTHFLKALAIRPDFALAYFALARDSKHQFADAELTRIRDLLNRDFLPLRDRINLHFALARVLDRGKAFDEAFQQCDRANASKRQLLHLQGNTFLSGAHAQFMDRVIATFDSDYFHRVQGFGSESELPVFIVGMPRSGTSLVEQILASHPAVFGAGEIRNLKQLVAELPAELGSADDYPECLASLDRVAARRLAERYLEELRSLGRGKPRVTDKVPMNFHQLGLIATLWPRARIIHCRRDPRDVCWSCYFQNFREVHFACDLRKLGAYHRQYQRLMAHWKNVLPVPILEVCYEELVEDLERISRDLVAYCGLPWHDACLRFYETSRTVRTSSNLQVRRPVYKSSVGYWKNYGAYLGPLFEALDQP